MKKFYFMFALATVAFSALCGGKIYDDDGNLKDLEGTNKMSQVAQDQTTVQDIADFGGKVQDVLVDGKTVVSGKVANVSSYGRVKRLGKYLWEATTEGEDFVAATNVLQQHYPVMGACSAVHAGKIHGRTYDWYYDKCAEFVVRNPAKDGKYASIGIATSFKSLTDDFLETGKWHPSMYEIPFAWVDGMNECGVVLQTNVTPLDNTKSTKWRTYSPEKYMVFLVVRYVLDNFNNAEDAADWIADNLYLPPSFPFDCHIMVSDRDSCFIVEDGIVVKNTSVAPTDVMTNFRIRGVLFDDNKIPEWDTIEDYGMGVERYIDVRTNGFDKTTVAGMAETMKRLYYTRAYSKGMLPDLFWYTEYVGDHTSEGYGILKVADAKPVSPDTRWTKFGTYADSLISEHLDEHNPTSANYRGGKSWQTVHMCVYDQENLVLRIWTQEEQECRMFTLEKNPGNFKVDLYEDYLEKAGTTAVIKVANDFTTESLTKKDIGSFSNFESNSVIGKLSNSGVGITVDGNKLSIMDHGVEKWSLDKDKDIPSTNLFISAETGTNIAKQVVKDDVASWATTGNVAPLTNVIINTTTLKFDPVTRTASGTIATCGPFPTGWTNNTTTLLFCESVALNVGIGNKSGVMYMGTVNLTDPGNEAPKLSEVVVTVVADNRTQLSQTDPEDFKGAIILKLETTSTNNRMRHWMTMYEKFGTKSTYEHGRWPHGKISYGGTNAPWLGMLFKPLDDQTGAEEKLSDKKYIAASMSDIDSKADKSTTLSGYGITDAYTKTQIDGNTVTNGGAVASAKAYADATFSQKPYGNGFKKWENGQWLGAVASDSFPGSSASSDTAKSLFRPDVGPYGVILNESTMRWEAVSAGVYNEFAYTSEIPSVSGFITAQTATNISAYVATNIVKDATNALATVAHSGNYNDLVNKPILKGFTTNDTVKIVASDIASGVIPSTNGFITASVATNAAESVTKNLLVGREFDFKDMRGVYVSLSNIIFSLGGSVTNFPSFQ